MPYFEKDLSAVPAGPAVQTWRLAHGRTLDLGERGHIQAVINVTPDSFSDGGCHGSTLSAVDAAVEMADAGAVIIDIGGESTRLVAIR